MQKNVKYQAESMSTCLEKFQNYAQKRGYELKKDTYGFYEVRHNNKKRILGAVKAVTSEGIEGWIINWADRQRRFIPLTDTTVVVGRKSTSTCCLREKHQEHRHKSPAPSFEIDSDIECPEDDFLIDDEEECDDNEELTNT